MDFQELSLKEKVEVTVNEFKRRDKVAAQGKKEADQYMKRKFFQVGNIIKSKKKGAKQKW
ncbi:hypothetical protein [Clostridium estertheticum]|uniref:Uncharacterized protein n=1 Tax=Clostridium estertheticum subsp. estertheticum TaxID=1552 RepID=A0A1J0GJK9_9CLOT|nr:hypothetical protein [Clostridium estertheticum]APC41548.1 hypothetical protein A7L45_16415 [Clostridium estertheticum subsp. estertheticum]